MCLCKRHAVTGSTGRVKEESTGTRHALEVANGEHEYLYPFVTGEALHPTAPERFLLRHSTRAGA